MAEDAASETRTLEDVRAEGLRLAEAARGAGLALKLMGGVAIGVLCPSAVAGPLSRTPGDVDFVSRSKLRPDVVRFFEDEGYAPDRLFNAIHGASRLNFADPARQRPIDVILDRFAMCHALDLEDRLIAGALTVPLVDLLLTKLQIVQLNDKDVRDIVAMLLDHDVEGGGPQGIEIARFTSVLGDDWGFEHTVRGTLATVRDRAEQFGLDTGAVELVRARIDALVAALDGAPKSLRWKLRARLGERVRWYELPEEVRR